MHRGELSLDSGLFRKLLDAAPDPTVIVDEAGVVVLANQRVESVFGHAGAELVGGTVETLVPRGLADTEGVVSARHRDGHEVPVEISLSPLETDAGVLLSASLRDVSARREIEEQAARMREELIATVSHELRTPLTSIIGYTELLVDLADEHLSVTARDLVGVIERNANRELRLVDDLLTMAFLDGKKLRVALASVDLAEVARRVVADHELRAHDARLALTFEGPSVPTVLGDFYRLVQVVENLVTNAIKFTPRGGSVRVSVAADADGGVLEVSDTGVGVSEEEKSLLFERLYRTPGAVAAHVQGAGLGLPIVKTIVEAHHGVISVDSEQGVGTTFRVRIPFVDGAAVTA